MFHVKHPLQRRCSSSDSKSGLGVKHQTGTDWIAADVSRETTGLRIERHKLIRFILDDRILVRS
jgi:hypothetical protein